MLQENTHCGASATASTYSQKRARGDAAAVDSATNSEASASGERHEVGQGAETLTSCALPVVLAVEVEPAAAAEETRKDPSSRNND